MKIDINKKYRTRNGVAVKIFKVIPEDQTYPDESRVLGAIILNDGSYDLCCWLPDGRFKPSGQCPDDLVEVSPYDDFKVDDKVVCWNDRDPEYRVNRYFAGISEEGKPLAFADGATSWSNSGGSLSDWDHCVKYAE